MPDYTVAVADLARFCHRSGDIDHRFSPSPSGPEGIAGHQRLYRMRPDSYTPEYPVECQRRVTDITLLLRGRADGYDSAEGFVEEIATQVPLGRVGRPEEVAAVATFLLADESSFVTGAEYAVDGGMAQL